MPSALFLLNVTPDRVSCVMYWTVTLRLLLLQSVTCIQHHQYKMVDVVGICTKQRVMIEFLAVEGHSPIVIHRCLRSIMDCDTYVGSLALRALGVCCLLSQDVAKKYILVFCFQLAHSEADEVCVMSVRVVFDLFLLYGLQPFQCEENGEEEADTTGGQILFDATGLGDADRDDITKSNNGATSAVNSSSKDLMRILTSLLDSKITAIFTHNLHL
ncbi:hypothetical protein Cfor_01985 [Coptotermes formosanus]|uniref:Nuclear condensin complex subunit 3 C-terminal domain-containing protein n=1 Tax=Coptotermes formosanus TaxID=36987 RepID=A0A6L2Q1U8_COPFO|nr:hypothetical protein Cfor_01985 [Coptotermes formosanus]